MQIKALLFKLFSASILGFTFQTNAFAEDWTSIIKKPNYEIFVDIDSYNVADGYPFIVTKTNFKTLQTIQLKASQLKAEKNKKLTSVTYLSVIKNQQFNCKNPLFRTKYAHYFNKSGKLSGTDNMLTVFESITPNSDAFAVGQLTCQVHQMLGGQ